MGKLFVEKDILVRCDRPRSKESRGWIGRNAYAACNHRSIDVLCSDLIPVRCVVEVTLGMPMMRKLMFHFELRAKGGYLPERLRELIECVHADRTGNGGLRILETWRIGCLLLLPNSIQPINLHGIARIHRARKQSYSQVNHPCRFLVERPIHAESRREVRKAAGRGLKLIAEACIQAEVIV